MENQKRLRFTLEIALDETRPMTNGEFAELITDVSITTRAALRPLAGEACLKLQSTTLEMSSLIGESI